MGRELVLLAEGESEETPLLWEGRTQFHAPEIDGKVYINDFGGLETLEPGRFYRAEITEAHDYDVVARVVLWLSTVFSSSRCRGHGSYDHRMPFTRPFFICTTKARDPSDSLITNGCRAADAKDVGAPGLPDSARLAGMKNRFLRSSIVLGAWLPGLVRRPDPASLRHGAGMGEKADPRQIATPPGMGEDPEREQHHHSVHCLSRGEEQSAGAADGA